MTKKKPAVLIFPSLLFLLLTMCSTPTVLVNKEQKQGDLFFNQHDYEEASRHYSVMLEASQKLGVYRNLSMEADVRRKLSNCFEMTGRYDLALVHIDEAFRLDSADNNILGKIEDLRQKGRILVYSGSYKAAITVLEKALVMCEGMDQSLKNDHRLTIADTYLALGQLYSITGKTGNSLKYTNPALELFESAGDIRGQMESLLTLGSLLADAGDVKSAQKQIERSLNMAEKSGLGTARHYHLLATILSAGGDYEEAIRCQEKAINDAGRVRIRSQIVWTLVGMGDIYRDLGDLVRADKYYRQAREIKDSSGVRSVSLDASMNMRLGDLLGAGKYFTGEESVSGSAIISLRLSELMMQTGKTDSALMFLDQGNEMFAQMGNRQGWLSVQLLKGTVMAERGEFSKAKTLLDSASHSSDYPDICWQAYFQTGRMNEKQNKTAEAIEAYRRSISVIEKTRGNLTIDEFKSIYINNKREVYDRLINILLKENKPVEAFQVSEMARARAFYDILSGRKISFKGSSGDPGLMNLEQDKRIEVQKLYLLLQNSAASSSGTGSRKNELAEIRKALEETQSEYQEILNRIRLSNPDYSQMIAPEPVSPSETGSYLPAQSALLSYWISDSNLTVWIIKEGGVKTKSVPVSRTELIALVEKAIRAIRANYTVDINSSLSKLYMVLLAPADPELSGITSLVIVPNGELHFLPFQALIDRKGNYLVSRFFISYAPSASVFKLCNTRKTIPGSRFMGIALGDLTIGNNAGLPGTEDEVRKILPLFKEKIAAIGQQGSEAFLRKNGPSYNFLHFATHGVYNYRQPLYSFLLFPPEGEDDGRLNVYEVFEYELNANLVTLSACETGLGNLSRGDEITGLTRAFLFAGSSAVVVSLWPVADYPTSLLMTGFYGFIKNHPFHEALTLAQRDAIKVFPQPQYWAPFVLVGNGFMSAM